MRVAMLLAALLLWVQPAKAVTLWTFAISAHVTGTNTPYTPGLEPQFIPINTTLNFNLTLPAFAGSTNIATYYPPPPHNDPTGLGGRAPIFEGLLSLTNGQLSGTNFRYIGGPAEYLCFGCDYYTLAGTFSAAYIRSSSTDFGVTDPPGPIPEPTTWALMLFGFGAIGAAMRRQRQRLQVRFAF